MKYLFLYGTGGLAYGDANLSVAVSSNLIAPAFSSVASSYQTRLGWAAGAGAELSLAEQWSVKVEWLHCDLGTSSVTNSYAVGASTLTTTVFENGNIFRGGINFKF